MPYPNKSVLQVVLKLCSGPGLLARIPLGQTPSLHLLRRRPKATFVRRLLWYYGSVRLPTLVHHRRTPSGFSMRTRQKMTWSTVGSPGSREQCLDTCMGSLTAQGFRNACQSAFRNVAFPSSLRGRRPKVVHVFRGSIPSLRLPLSTLQERRYRRPHMTRRLRGWLDFRSIELASITPCRF